MRTIAATIAVALLLAGSLFLILRDSTSPTSVEVAATSLMDDAEAVVNQPQPESESLAPEEKVELMRRKSLGQSVAAAQVIVVATAIGTVPAPPNVPGDQPENFIQFQVVRVLKGTFAAAMLTTRTPTAASEFIGKDWVVMLSPEFVAKKHSFA